MLKENSTQGIEASKDLFIAQYEALRSEILLRLEKRQELLTYTQIGAASFLSIGLQPGFSVVTVMAYPPLALFLACAWSQHDNRIGQVNQFLREIEDTYLQSFLGWERYRRATFTKKRLSLFDSVSFSARGLFAGTELLALIIGIARFMADPQMMVVFLFLVVIDALAILATILVLTHRRVRAVEACNG